MDCLTTDMIIFPGESREYGVDFKLQPEIVTAGRTLAAPATVTQETLEGSASLTIGSPSISGTKVFARITASTVGCRYAITFSVATSGGDTLKHIVYLSCLKKP